MIDIVMFDVVWQDVEDGIEVLLQDWLVKFGDVVSVGQVLVVVELVKIMYEVVVFVDGVVVVLEVVVQDIFGCGVVFVWLELKV